MIGNGPFPRGNAQKYTLTLEGTGDDTYCYVEIDGVRYTSPAALEVERGTVVLCVVGNSYPSSGTLVTYNGVAMTSPPAAGATASYRLTISKPATTITLAFEVVPGVGYQIGSIDIVDG